MPPGAADMRAKLETVLPDELSPREALDRLYELMSVYADFRHMLVEASEELFL